MRYVCGVNMYSNCRAHDGGWFSGLKFFKGLKEVMEYMVSNQHEELLDLHTSTGKHKIEVKYEISGHGVSRMILKVKGQKYATIDNGHGVKVWERL